jgi:hypothetical protein
LIGILAATPARVQSLLDKLSDGQLRKRLSADEFSIVENVCHLRDIEVEGYTPRINRILNEDRPALADIDGGRLAIEREYNRQDVYDAWRAFAQARADNTRTLSRLEPGELNRVGTLEGVGIVKLEELLMMMVEHDNSHLEDVERIRQQLNTHSTHSAA